MTLFASLKSLVTRAAVPARVEGGRINGPLAPVQDPVQGWIPMSWPLNFWQCGFDVIQAGNCSIVDACIWAYIRAIAQLPGYHRIENDDGGVEDVKTSALSRILRFPNSYQTSPDFLTHGVRSLLYNGNWYSLAIRNARQEVAELHWLNPKLCRVYHLKVEGQLLSETFYSIGNDGGNPVLNPEELINSDRFAVVPARDILHVKLYTDNDPLVGLSWLAHLAWDLANRAGMTAGISSFFANAAKPSGVITTDMTFTEAQVEELRAKWNRQTTGANAGGTPILTGGLKWQQTGGMTSNDASLVGALKLSDQQICGVFGVPPILVGVEGGKPFATTEALINDWHAGGLGDVLARIENAFDQFFGLAGPTAGEWTEYDLDALLRTDLLTRIDAMARGVQGGIWSPNEARAREGLPAVEAGAEPRVQQQVVPLSFALEPPTPPSTSSGLAVPAAGDQPPSDQVPEDQGKLYDLVAYAKGLEAYERVRLAA